MDRKATIDVTPTGLEVKPKVLEVCQGDKIVWTISNCSSAECGPAAVEIANRKYVTGNNCKEHPDDFMAKWFLFFSCDFGKVVKPGAKETIECEVKKDACDTYHYDVLAHVTREYKVARFDALPRGLSGASRDFLLDPEVEVQGSTFPPPEVRSSPGAVQPPEPRD
jgi:hypothetical protein